MRAAVWYGRNDIKVQSVSAPKPSSGEVKVRIKSCGVCGSDVHEYYEGPFLIPVRPHPLTGRSLGPVILGHEIAGEVVEIGEGVQSVGIGDQVVVNPLIYCGNCHYCRKGQYIMCTSLGTYGFAADGGFAEYAVFPARSVFKIPPNLSSEEAAFAEPAAVAVHAVRRAELQLGDTVAVIGGGPIGLLVLQTCLAAGARDVFLVEPIESRRRIGARLGARETFDPTKGNVGKEIAALTEGLRVDVAFDCVGSQSSFETAVSVTSRRGRICIVGMALKPIAVSFMRLWSHEKKVIFASGYEEDFSTALKLLSDLRVKVRDLVTDRVNLKDLVQSFGALRKDPANHIKVMVIP